MSSQEHLFTAYIDLSFLKRLLRSKPDPLEDLDGNWPETWRDVFSFLRQHARVVVDGTEEEVLGDEVLTRVLLSSGLAQPKFKPGIAKQVAHGNTSIVENPFTVFLFEDCEKPLEVLRKRTGLLFLQHGDLNSRWPLLFQSHSFDVHDGEPTFGWDDLIPHAQPLNAIMVVDKYAFGQLASPPKFAQNIGKLLLSLLPDEPPDCPIHITIVTGLKKAIGDHRHKIESLFDTASHFLRKQTSKLNIQLRIMGFQKNQHEDRLVFTNYGMFLSGDSFDYFREDGTIRKDTLIEYIPIKGHEAEVFRRLSRFGQLDAKVPCAVNYKAEVVSLACGWEGNRLLECAKGNIKKVV